MKRTRKSDAADTKVGACPLSRGTGDLGHSTEPSCPCLQTLTALLSLQKKDDKKVVNGKAAEQEDVSGVWAPQARFPQPRSGPGHG